MRRPKLHESLSLCILCIILVATVGHGSQADVARGDKARQPSARLRHFRDKSSHETKSPTSLGSLYMNIADGSQLQYGIAPASSASSSLMGYGPQVFALGAEDQQQQSHMIGQNILVAEANQPSSNEMIMGQPTGDVYTQPADMMPSNAQTNRQQNSVLASIYIDQFGNNQLRVPQGARISQLGGEASPHNAGSVSNGFYSHQHSPPEPSLQQQSASLYTNQAFPPQQSESPQSYSPMVDIGRGATPRKTPKKKLIFDAPKFSRELSLKPARSNDSLTNAQLMSLIDELKEFNSKQASSDVGHKPASGAIGLREDEVQNDDDDIDDDTSTVDTKHSSASEPAKSSERREEKKLMERQAEFAPDDSKVSADDLAKFAKFLMTKEGANMRFQLGLDKEAPDDGDVDDDDKDALLESKKTTKRQRAGGKASGAKAPSGDSTRDLNELDKKHSEVASQMDTLLENLTGTLNKAAKEEEEKEKEEQRKRRRKSSRRGDDFDNEDLKARARRNSPRNGRSSHEAETKMPTHETAATRRRPHEFVSPRSTKHERGHSSNLAKKLIEQDMMQDKLESNIRSIREAEKSEPRTREAKPEGSASPKSTSRGRKKRRGVDSAELSGGEENEEYPRKARKRDHIQLIHELQKARQDRARARSEPSKVLNKDPVLRQALAGELGVQAETHPDGRLTVTSGRGQALTVKLPKKSSRVVHADYDENAREDRDKPAGEPTAGEKLKHVKIGSEQPIKDEYPISEKVSSRLNLLSNNLDRYFNDGFMNEIENRARINNGPTQGDKSPKSDHQQAESSNVNETSTAGDQAATKGDRDFDVNVGVDGKRDAPDKDEDYDEDEEEPGETPAEAGYIEAKPKRKDKDVPAKGRRKRKSASGALRMNKRKETQPAGPSARPKNNNERRAGSLKQRLSAGEKHLSFEDRGDRAPDSRPDPVEGESFESPIGPDTDNLDLLMPPAADKKVESSRESKQVLTRNGKRVTAKFYEEPDWR